MSAFWTAGNVELVRKYRFYIWSTRSDIDLVWWAKSVTKPTFDVSEGQYQLVNTKFKYPGITTWNDVTITTVDPILFRVGNQRTNIFGDHVNFAQLLLRDFETKANWKLVNSKESLMKMFSQETANGGVVRGGLHIVQIDSNGKELERWVLYNPWVKQINFGDLTYDSDDASEINITLAYDWASIENTSDATAPK